MDLKKHWLDQSMAVIGFRDYQIALLENEIQLLFHLDIHI